MAIQALAALLGGSPRRDEPEPQLNERDVRSKLYEDHSTGNVTRRPSPATARRGQGRDQGQRRAVLRHIEA
jgi:hypothetical protein